MGTMTTGQVADHFKVLERRIQTMIREGKLRPKPQKVRGKRVWTKGDVERLRAVLEQNS